MASMKIWKSPEGASCCKLLVLFTWIVGYTRLPCVRNVHFAILSEWQKVSLTLLRSTELLPENPKRITSGAVLDTCSLPSSIEPFTATQQVVDALSVMHGVRYK